MTDLNIPNLNINSEKYIFKKKLNLRRKSNKRLLTESALMFILCLLLLYINYLIPNKSLLLQKLPAAFDKSFVLVRDLLLNLYDILLVIFIFTSSLTVFILLVGCFYRLLRVSKRKSKKINYNFK